MLNPRLVEAANQNKITDRLGKAATLQAWWIAVLLLFSMTVNFMDRLVLGSVAPTLQLRLHFTNTQYAYIVFAFSLGMTLGQVPAGALIDRIGFRAALPSLLAGWSLTNLMQALARTVSAFSGLRFVMGLFECGNYPAGVKAMGELLPPDQRAFALGIFNSGSLLGSVIASPLVVYTTIHYGWQTAFVIPSLIGLIWLLPWLQACRAAGSNTPRSSDPLPEQINLGDLLRLRQVWGVVAMRVFTGPLTAFYWFWLPLYLVRSRGVTLGSMAGMASLAYFFGGIGQAGGGYFSGWLIRQGRSVDAARKITIVLGGVLAAVCTFGVPLAASAKAACLLAAMGIFGANVMSNIQISVVTDAFPPSVQARVMGLTGVGEGSMNMLMSLSTGFLIDWFSFPPVFMAAACLPAGALCALFYGVRECRPISPGGIERGA